MVPENRAAPPGGRTIAIRVMVLPARGATKEPDPLVFFNGGPGLSTIAYAGYASWALDALRNTRDLLLIDMRGTGGPNALGCDLYDDAGRLAPYLRPMFPLRGVRACAARLERSVDLTQYTTRAAVQDFDAVRAALRIDRLNIYGASYGTRLALEYMREFPAHVRRAVLLGVIPPEVPIGREFARGTEHALDQAFRACAADSTCHGNAPDPRQDIATLLDGLRTAPAEVHLWNSRRHFTERDTLTAPALAELLWQESYSPDDLPRVFPLVHLAVTAGDYTPLATRLLAVSRARRSGRREGLTLSVVCAEDVPRLSPHDPHDDQTLLGAPAVDDLIAACALWPRGQVSLEYTSRVVSSVPTLLMSGGHDPVAPSDLADSAALGLSRSERYLDPHQGHAELDGAGRRRIAEFVTRP